MRNEKRTLMKKVSFLERLVEKATAGGETKESLQALVDRL